jgi:hypothetical protein
VSELDDRRPAWVMLVALVAVVAGIVGVSTVAQNLTRRNDLGPEPSIPGARTSHSAPSTAPAEVEPTVAYVKTSGDYTWAWDDHEIRRYAGGTWSFYASAPSSVRDLAYTSDTLWTAGSGGLRSFDDGVWQRPEAVSGPFFWLCCIAAAPDNGVLWLSTGEDLYRFDGIEATNVGHPFTPGGYVGQIAVTVDGTVWAGGLYGYAPWVGGLARYDPDTRVWETVRPLGGDDDVPAWTLAPSPDGDLWALMYDWPHIEETTSEFIPTPT